MSSQEPVKVVQKNLQPSWGGSYFFVSTLTEPYPDMIKVFEKRKQKENNYEILKNFITLAKPNFGLTK